MADPKRGDRYGERRSAGSGWRRLPRVVRQARRGQGLVEFALAVPAFMLLVMAIIAFGLLYENKVAMDNAVRDGARYAATFPNSWSNAASAPHASIQGYVQNSGGTAQIPNHCIDQPGSCTVNSTCNSDNGNFDGIDICYTDTTLLQQCGYYNASSGAFYADASYTESACLAPDNTVTVRAMVHYKVPVPILSAMLSLFFPNGVPIESTATMRLEQPCASC